MRLGWTGVLHYYQILFSLARFPPKYAVTTAVTSNTVWPACLFSTCATKGIKRHTHEGKPCTCSKDTVAVATTSDS